MKTAISLSERVCQWAEELAAKKGCDNFSQYVADLIRREKSAGAGRDVEPDEKTMNDAMLWVAVVLVAVITAFWILFPLLVYFRLRSLERQVEETNRRLHILANASVTANVHAAVTAESTRQLAKVFEGGGWR